jgi:transposase
VRIAEAFGVTEAAVSQWVKAAREGGVEALRSKSRHGQAARLSDEQLQHVLMLLERGAASFGFVGDIWTCSRIAYVIERELGVQYHPAHVSRLLHQQNWTYQKPIVRASQRDEAIISDWLTRGWPAIKKKPTKRLEPSSSSMSPGSF